jgi:hypothetical protein
MLAATNLPDWGQPQARVNAALPPRVSAHVNTSARRTLTPPPAQGTESRFGTGYLSSGTSVTERRRSVTRAAPELTGPSETPRAAVTKTVTATRCGPRIE